MSDQRDHGGYGPGQDGGHGHDDQGYRGFAAPNGADGSYVPEPLPSPPPPHIDQGAPFGAPPAGDDWSGHSVAQDGGPYAAAPLSGDGWGGTSPAAHPWPAGAQDPQAPWPPAQPPYGTQAADAGFDGYGGGPGYAGAPEYGGAPGYPGAGFDPAGQAGPATYDAGFSTSAGQPGTSYGTPGFDPAGPPGAAPYDAGFSASAGQAGTGFDPAGHVGPATYDAGFSASAGQPGLGYGGGGDAGAQWPQPHAYAYGDAQPQGVEHTAVLAPVAVAPDEPGGPAAGERRTGSPIIAPGVQPAALTAALGLLLAGGAAVGKPGLTVVLVLLQAVTAAGWFRLNGMWPARQGIALAFLAGVTADVAMLAAEGRHAPEVVVGTLGVWLLLVLVLQLRHHGSADERLSSLTATSASTLVTILACGYLAALGSDAGKDPVVAGAVAVAAATLVRALPLPGGEPVSLAAALAAAAATGALTGPAGDLGAGKGLLLALACGACALVGLRVASYDWPSRFVHFTAGVALPLTAAAPVVYALGRALT